MKKFFSVSVDWLQSHWRGLVSSLIIATLAVLTLSLQLTTLVPGQNKFETIALSVIQKTPWPWQSPESAPYNVPVYIIGKVTADFLQAGRIVSVMYALLATACLFYVLKKWFNIRMATVGSLLFVTSSWLLHLAHVATPLILMVFAPLACLAAFTWLIRTKRYKIFAILTFVGALGFAAYVPYMTWVLLVTVAVLYFQSKDKIKSIESWQWIAGGALYFALVLPLLVGLVKDPSSIRVLLGIPANLPSFNEYLNNLLNLILAPFFRSPLMPELHLGRLPLLDIFSTTMFLLGVYYYVMRPGNRRSIILFASFGLLLLILPLTPLYLLGASILLPLIYIFIVSGIVELLNQWFSYFPRNPLARSIGVGVVVIAIGFTSFYHLQRYFIAWPNTPDTKTVYVVQLTDKK